MSSASSTNSRKTHAASARRLGLELFVLALVFSALLYFGLYSQLKGDAMEALEVEGASYVNLLVNVGDWTSWHSSGELRSEAAADGSNVFYHLADLRPINPAFLPDSWEQEALESFYAGESASASAIERRSDEDVYRYMEPVRIRESCLGCHSDYKVGDPRGGISVEIPMAWVQTRLARGRLTYGGMGMLTLLGMLALGGAFLSVFQRRVDDANKRLEEMAVTDDLTGAPNRRAVMAHLAEEFERSRRSGDPLSVIVLDIDRFKVVNDTLGHAAGDEVLAEFARRALGSIRSYDMFGRMGGEEFLVIAPGTAPPTAERLAHRLLDSVRAEVFRTDSGALAITASAGIATIADEDAGIDSLLARADEALYGAKEGGRDRLSTDSSV